MRMLLSTVLISFFLALLLVLFCSIASHDISNQFIRKIDQADSLIQQHRWPEAAELISDVSQHWQQKSMLLSMWVCHQEVEQVAAGLTLLSISVENQELYHARLYAAEISAALSLIDHRDAFALKNIL